MAAPNPPTSLLVLQGADPSGGGAYNDGVRLRWTRPASVPAPVEHYVVEVSKSPFSTWTLATVTTADEATEAMVRGIPVGSTVEGRKFRVKAVNADGSSSYLTSANSTTFGARPPSTGLLGTCDLSAAAGGATQINLEFSHDTPIDQGSGYWGFTHWRLRWRRLGFDWIFQDFDWARTEVTLTGLLPGTSYEFQVAKVFVDSNDSNEEVVGDFGPNTAVMETTDAGSPGITGPSTITVRAGRAISASFTFVGGGTITSTVVSGIPNYGLNSRSGSNIYDLTGVVETPGRYECAFEVTSIDGLAEQASFTKEFVLLVTGGDFIADLHDDPLACDLQLDLRAEAVRSYNPGFGENGLRVVRGDPIDFAVPLRDGSAILAELPTALRLVVRPVDQYAAEPLLTAIWDGETTVMIGGIETAVLTVVPNAPDLDDIFAQLNRAGTANIGARFIAGMGEVTATISGRTLTFDMFATVIAQDLNQ